MGLKRQLQNIGMSRAAQQEHYCRHLAIGKRWVTFRGEIKTAGHGHQHNGRADLASPGHQRIGGDRGAGVDTTPTIRSNRSPWRRPSAVTSKATTRTPGAASDAAFSRIGNTTRDSLVSTPSKTAGSALTPSGVWTSMRWVCSFRGSCVGATKRPRSPRTAASRDTVPRAARTDRTSSGSPAPG